MRVYLTKSELETVAGQQLLDLAVRIASDGVLDIAEIKMLRDWLRANKDNEYVAAINYLSEIMTRIAADGVIDRDEMMELFLAIERVVPTSQRQPITRARKAREAARRTRIKAARQLQREKEREAREQRRQEEQARRMRLRHAFAKVAGVTFPNRDGSERQEIIKQCKVGETLVFRHDANSRYSTFAMQVLRKNGRQLGHVPEYFAEQMCNELESGNRVIGVIKDLTGGTWEKPIRGVNFLTIFAASDVSLQELEQYVNRIFAEENQSNRPAYVSLGGVFQMQRRKPWWKFW